MDNHKEDRSILRLRDIDLDVVSQILERRINPYVQTSLFSLKMSGAHSKMQSGLSTKLIEGSKPLVYAGIRPQGDPFKTILVVNALMQHPDMGTDEYRKGIMEDLKKIKFSSSNTEEENEVIQRSKHRIKVILESAKKTQKCWKCNEIAFICGDLWKLVEYPLLLNRINKILGLLVDEDNPVEGSFYKMLTLELNFLKNELTRCLRDFDQKSDGLSTHLSLLSLNSQASGSSY
uniref:Uncharacterized protein n=1 Tax=Insect orthomyxo-like virus 1 TaxID=2819085 RepID=A0A8F5XPF0_9ORTO|nr:hypothetical protein [Insect orthomyxo-like virus 1]